MLTFREFYSICEGKKSNTPPHAVPGTYVRHADGGSSYTLEPYKGPNKPATKKEIKKLVINRSGGKAVKQELKRRVKEIKKIAEQTPAMEPDYYSQQIAKRQVAQKSARIKHVDQEIGATARAQEAAKQRRLKAIMSR